MQYKSLICELIEVANRIVSNNFSCAPANIIPDGCDCNYRNCDDCRIDVDRYIRDLADRLALAHKAELKTLKKRYKTDLQNARESRDIAIKEASKLRNDKRLMPQGMEWTRFEDGMQITWDDAPEDITAVCLSLDGSCYSLHYDIPDDERMCIYEVSERVKRHVTEVIGADGLPIEVANTKPDTQERINDDATMYPHEYCKKHGIRAGTSDDVPFALSDFVEPMALDLLRRQRELDARTIGGE